jgi:hypothetical protein
LSFWKETFGLGKDALRTLTNSATSYKLAEYKHKGQKKTEKETMCREFIATVPRHYSHFSVSSCNEYVDCASNALNWWRGPLERNADGTTSPCFLQWLDQRHQTNHLQVFTESGWFPGVNKGEMPPAVRDAEDDGLFPTPAVSYKFFWAVLSKLQIKYKDKAIDQCAKCNVLRGKNELSTVPHEAVLLQAELEAHQIKADKGYFHRAICISKCHREFTGIELPAPTVPCFPPGAALVEPQLYPDAMDFVQVDMGGGQRTPKIKAGPQYYLRTLPSLPLYICSSSPRGNIAMWWNETIAHRGGDEMISCQYLYDTTRATGAGSKRFWVDGTASQSWNRKFWQYLIDCCNPESPTFHQNPSTSLYKRIDLYRNPPGHTFMEPDRQHGIVVRYGNRQSHVASTREWSEKICALCKPADPIDSIFMDRSFFRNWTKYLSQMYRKNPRSCLGQKYKVLDFYWANFGWGTTPSGHLIHHPHEVWLYTCSGPTLDEWHMQEPVKVAFGRNVKVDGTAPARPAPILEWLRQKKRVFQPITHASFIKYDAPLPLEVAKQQDLRVLSTFLARYMPQHEIDELYPQPEGNDDSDGSDNTSDGSE